MYRVFVFPSCNEPGLEVIQALSKSNKIALYGGSSGEPANDPSYALLQHHIQCPWYDDADFKEKFLQILEEHQIDLVIPCWDPLVALFSSWAVERPRFATPPADTAQILLSKGATYAALCDVVPCPAILGENDIPSGLAFAKPDQGSGSAGSFLVESQYDLEVARHRNLLVTEYLPGKEYTVDCFSDMAGELLLAHVRERSVIGRGIALSSRSLAHPLIEEYCQAIANALPLHGGWFAQFKENAQGEPVLLEVNARLGGSTGLTRCAGANIALMSVFLFMGEAVRVPRVQQNISITRNLTVHVEEASFSHVIWDLDDTLIRKDGKPDPGAVACLFDCRNRGLKQYLMTKNPEAVHVLEEEKIPLFFEEVCVTEDKVAVLDTFLARHGIAAEDAIMINDSYAERFQLEELYPALRIIAPDALAVLGFEKSV